MLEFLFIICQYMDGDMPVMRKVDVVRDIVICSPRGCSDGFRVVFIDTVSAVNVYQTECLYVTRDNKDALTYQE